MPRKRSIDAIIRATLKPPKKSKRQYLGFANEHEEQLFRAIAGAHPKAVRIVERKWRFYADEHVKLGTFSCTIYDAPTYRLTRHGVERAVEARLLRES